MTNFDQIAHLLGVLALLLIAGRMAGHAAARIGLPSVLGELCVGILLGTGLVASKPEVSIVWDFLSELGVLLLLFSVGLESRLADLRKVGVQSFLVATIGIVIPVILGVLVARAFGIVESFAAQLFIGAALSATSVGLTARVLRDLKQNQSKEAQVILGAAVIDDILGLVLLAILSTFARSQAVDINFFSILLSLAKALSFLVLAVLVGQYVLPPFFRIAVFFLGQGAVLTAGLAICFVYSWSAHQFGLAPAIGAFFAGLMIQVETYAPIRAHGDSLLETHLESLGLIFVPLFFVLTGMKVDLAALANGNSLCFALVLLVAAVVGKLLSGLGCGTDVRKIIVGVGMVPRGEVGLIFAALGSGIIINGKALLPPAAFSSVVIAVAATSIIAPIWLGILLRRQK